MFYTTVSVSVLAETGDPVTIFVLVSAETVKIGFGRPLLHITFRDERQ